MKATITYGNLEPIPNCSVIIPIGRNKTHEIKFRILPDITDSKSAQYQDEPVIGRSFPIKTFSHSENRAISMKMHFMLLEHSDAVTNMLHLRAIQSAVYPREDDSETNGIRTPTKPYLPPPICKLKCGTLLSGGFLCVVLKSYSVSFPTDVVWYEKNLSYLPYKFDIDTNWDVVYPNERLPGQQTIMKDF